MSAPVLPSFVSRLLDACLASGSALCVGLDPEPAALPPHLNSTDGVLTFCQAIIDATADLVCAYKPNLAFFERLGPDGWRILERVITMVPAGIPVIADGKRADIGNTSRAYAEAIYDQLGAAACTVNPYLGVDAVRPLLDHPRGFAFVLCRTSNPGAGAIQDIVVEGRPLHAHVAELFASWLGDQRAGLVIGAQERTAFGWAARIAPRAPILVPGIGAQGGTVDALAEALTPEQRGLVVVSVSRAIIHAGRDRDFAAAARRAATAYHTSLRDALATVQERHPDAAAG